MLNSFEILRYRK